MMFGNKAGEGMIERKKVQNVRSECRIYITTIKLANHVSFVRVVGYFFEVTSVLTDGSEEYLVIWFRKHIASMPQHSNDQSLELLSLFA